MYDTCEKKFYGREKINGRLERAAKATFKW